MAVSSGFVPRKDLPHTDGMPISSPWSFFHHASTLQRFVQGHGTGPEESSGVPTGEGAGWSC